MAEYRRPIRSLLSMGSYHLQLLRMIIIVRGDHSTFASCHVLSSVETETRHIADRTDFGIVIFSAVSLCRIFDQNNASLPCKLLYWIKIGWKAIQMDGHDRFRVSCHYTLDCVGSNRVSVRVNVSKYGFSSTQ